MAHSRQGRLPLDTTGPPGGHGRVDQPDLFLRDRVLYLTRVARADSRNNGGQLAGCDVRRFARVQLDVFWLQGPLRDRHSPLLPGVCLGRGSLEDHRGPALTSACTRGASPLRAAPQQHSPTDRVGFEPTVPLRAHRFSRPAVSTAHAPVRMIATAERSTTSETSGREAHPSGSRPPKDESSVPCQEWEHCQVDTRRVTPYSMAAPRVPALPLGPAPLVCLALTLAGPTCAAQQPQARPAPVDIGAMDSTTCPVAAASEATAAQMPEDRHERLTPLRKGTAADSARARQFVAEMR